jgi:hypothetical protein
VFILAAPLAGRKKMDLPTFLKFLDSDEQILLISFCLAIFLSVFPGYFIIRVLYDFILHNAKSHDRRRTFKQVVEGLYDTKASPASGLVGCLERSLYIFGVMSGESGVITAVVILKAFFAWATEGAATAGTNSTERTQSTIILYYAYLIGNFLSLILGLALGELGIWYFPSLLTGHFGLTCHALCGKP